MRIKSNLQHLEYKLNILLYNTIYQKNKKYEHHEYLIILKFVMFGFTARILTYLRIIGI